MVLTTHRAVMVPSTIEYEIRLHDQFYHRGRHNKLITVLQRIV